MEHVAAIPSLGRLSPRSRVLHWPVAACRGAADCLARASAALARVLFGIGAQPRRSPARRWWDEADAAAPSRDATSSAASDAAPRSLSLPKAAAPRQLSFRELEIPAGDAAAAPARDIAPLPAPAEAAPRRLPGSVGLSERSGTLRTLVDLVSRPAAPAVPVTRPLALRETERVASLASALPRPGAVARQLVLSQSLSSAKSGDVRPLPSVPRTAILPRFQLFGGCDGVVADKDGSLSIPSRGRKGRGNVFFV